MREMWREGKEGRGDVVRSQKASEERCEMGAEIEKLGSKLWVKPGEWTLL